jgi:hypothetical protein
MGPTDRAIAATVRRRRAAGFAFVGLLLGIDVFATGVLGGSERTLAIVRSIVLPGLPFLEWHAGLGVAAIASALAAIGAWLRWGVDWLVGLIMVVCLALAAFAMPFHHAPAPSHEIVTASHEFTVVLVLFALVARLRLLIGRWPGADWIRARLPEGLLFPAVDTARAAALAGLKGSSATEVARGLQDPRLQHRAASVNRWARFRTRGEVLDGAHAPLRAALSLCGLMSAASERRFRDESRAHIAGVPDSEPTWIRPLDGMLAALALQRLGEGGCVVRWRWIFSTRFALRHGRRPAALHVPSMLGIGTAQAWEHAAATALAHHAGWIDDDDWVHLRPRCLAAAASDRSDPDALRLVGAGRMWAELTRDAEALQILGRRTIAEDELARWLDELASEVGRELSGGYIVTS